MPKKLKSMLRGRDSGTGRFITIAEARRRKKTAQVNRIPIPKRPKKKG